MRFVYTALAFVLLLLNLAMISSLAHLTPLSVLSGNENSVNESSHVTLEINYEGPDATSLVKASQPTAISVSAEDKVKVKRSMFTSFVEMISKMSMSHTVWILMSAGLVLILVIPDVADLYMKVARKKK